MDKLHAEFLLTQLVATNLNNIMILTISNTNRADTQALRDLINSISEDIQALKEKVNNL